MVRPLLANQTFVLKSQLFSQMLSNKVSPFEDLTFEFYFSVTLTTVGYKYCLKYLWSYEDNIGT